MNKWLVLVLLMVYCAKTCGSELADIQKAYQQVKNHHRTDPTQAIELWQQHQSKIALLPAAVQYQWQKYTVIALMINADYPQAAKALGQLVYTEQAQSRENILTLSNLAGVILSHVDKSKLSQKAYQCALKQQPSKPLIKARLLHNLALSQVSEQEINDAINNFKVALKIANQQKSLKKVALYSANLGYAYLYARQPDKALPYFKRSLFLEEQNNNSEHKIKVALYLLNTITQLKQWNLYDRYLGNVNRMVKSRSDYWIENYFTWVTALAKSLRTGIKPNNEEKARLLAELNDEKSIRALNNDYAIMAKLLDITLPSNQPVKQRLASVDDKQLIKFVTECVAVE